MKKQSKSKKVGMGKEFKDAIQEEIEQAFYNSWEKVIEQLESEVDLVIFPCGSGCSVEVWVDGGHEWVSKDLSSVVDDRIENDDYDEDCVTGLETIAADFERQAIKLRKAASELRDKILAENETNT